VVDGTVDAVVDGGGALVVDDAGVTVVVVETEAPVDGITEDGRGGAVSAPSDEEQAVAARSRTVANDAAARRRIET
jgi:hypothetical protein